MASKRKKPPQVLVLNGPNLNMLGKREPAIYGKTTYAELVKLCVKTGEALGLEVDCRQSNHEGQLIDWLHEARDKNMAVVINPGGYAHTSIALMDAIKLVQTPVIEVHLSNIHARESFRQHSYLSKAAQAMICGFGSQGYIMALHGIAGNLKKKR